MKQSVINTNANISLDFLLTNSTVTMAKEIIKWTKDVRFYIIRNHAAMSNKNKDKLAGIYSRIFVAASLPSCRNMQNLIINNNAFFRTVPVILVCTIQLRFNNLIQQLGQIGSTIPWIFHHHLTS